tara:strand:+ start:15929 stop:17017 length:1089 start_codon:yes stop_codon:yes gene_type:complete
MKNIILFYPSFERGGVKRNFINFLRILKKFKLKTFIITDGKIEKKYLNKNTEIKLIKKNNLFKFFFYKVFSSLYSVLTLISLIFKIKKKNLIVYSFQSSFFPSIICFFLNVKMYIRVSEDPIGATIYADERIFSSLVFLSKIITYNFSSRIIVNSELMKKNVGSFIINKSKVTLIHNPSVNKILNYKDKNFSGKKNYFLNVGRLCKQKNQINLIKAFYKFNKSRNDYKLLICGDGPYKNKLKGICKELGILKRVKFYGWVKNTKKIYKKSKFFILTSLYEGLSNSLIDALNHGLVCCSTDVSGSKDILSDDRLIIKKNNTEEIYKKMLYLDKNYNKLKKNKKINLEKFLISKAVDSYKKILI